VTMTRARHCLIVPDSSSLYARTNTKSSRTDFAGLVGWRESAPPSGFPDAPPVARLENLVTSTTANVVSAGVALDPATLAAANRISKAIPLTQTPSRLAHGTDAANLDSVDPAAPPADPLDEDFIPLLGAGGKTYGTWWHNTLQCFPWRGDVATRDALVAETIEAIPAVEQWRERAAAEFATFLVSATLREIIAAGSHFQPEIPFAHALAGEPPTWVEGVLDLLVLRADGSAWIVDWKTDRQRADESAEQLLTRLKSTYAAQLQAYAAAIQAAGRDVTRRTIYSTALGSAIDC
jgi:ATP-dependent exoDNAse (exonuclease V) beta subunit